MRLLVITNLFAPDRGGGAAVITDMCEGLAAAGHWVTVYTTHPYYPEWRRKSEGSPWRVTHERHEGVEVVRHGMVIPRRPSSLAARAVSDLSLAVSMMRSVRSDRDSDVVMVFCPVLGAVAFARIRKWLNRTPLWLNIQDIPADAASGTGMSRSNSIGRLVEIIQQRLFDGADVWSTISPVMADRLDVMKPPGTPLHVCPNWLHSSIEAAVAESTCTRPQRANSTELLYAGNIGLKQGLAEFCTVLSRERWPFTFRIFGDGAGAPTVRKWVQESRDPRFKVGPFLPEDDFVRALRACDLFVITERPGSGPAFLPSKLVPAAASGTPVLAICDDSSPLGVEVTRHGMGIQGRWDDLPRALEQARATCASPEEMERLRSSCIARAADAYDRRRALHRLERLLEDLVHSGDRRS